MFRAEIMMRRRAEERSGQPDEKKAGHAGEVKTTSLGTAHRLIEMG